MVHKKINSILVVISEPDIADLFVEMLQMDVEKYHVRKAHSGKECLHELKMNKPDMILLDIEISDMDGWELIEKIIEIGTQVVIITDRSPNISDFMRLSMVSDYLMKPVTLDGLHMAVKDALEVPPLLERCIESLKNNKDKEDMFYLLFLLLKQGIADKKRFFLMRQLYPDKKIKDDHETRIMLENLKEKIDKTHNEIEYFKNNKCLIA